MRTLKMKCVNIFFIFLLASCTPICVKHYENERKLTENHFQILVDKLLDYKSQNGHLPKYWYMVLQSGDDVRRTDGEDAYQDGEKFLSTLPKDWIEKIKPAPLVKIENTIFLWSFEEIGVDEFHIHFFSPNCPIHYNYFSNENKWVYSEK